MKVYQILATIVVEDIIEEQRIRDICRENIETSVNEDFRIANCATHYTLKETINYPDTPLGEGDPTGKHYDRWLGKSQEVIDRYLIEMRNP
jgi:hypothetical protein